MFGQDQRPKQWKNPAELDLYTAFSKETDLKKKVVLLDQWKQKYPDSDFKVDGLLQYLPAYEGLRMPEKVIETGAEILTIDPKNLWALYFMIGNTQHLTRPTPALLNQADQAAGAVLANLDELFALSRKPANVGEPDWKKTRAEAENTARADLGWTAMQRKDFGNAEKLFRKALEANANSGQVAYWLAEVIRLQGANQRQAEVLYLYARAAYYDGEGALNPQGRERLDKVVAKSYTSYHGEDPKGLGDLKALARSQALPPADFKIESSEEIAARAQRDLAEKDPQLALWISIKNQLLAAGDQYFETSMKGLQAPKFRGTLVSQSPALRPKELVLAVEKPGVPDVTLKLAAPLTGKAAPGTVIEFEGIPSSYSRERFMVTFDVEGKDKITGWPTPAPPKKNVTKKKAI